MQNWKFLIEWWRAALQFHPRKVELRLNGVFSRRGFRLCGALEREAAGRRMVSCGTGGASGDGERAIIGSADRVMQKMPKPVAFLKRFHFPMWLVGEQDHPA
jgi:hypothetical protein